MKYSECKQVLYNSKNMLSIPDKWKEEVPIIFDEGEKRKLGFLYSIAKDGKVKLKKMIAVSTESAEITEYSIEELQENYYVSDQYLEAISIKDYDVYFSQKEEYETLISDIVDGDSCIKAEYFLQLTKALFSAEQFEKVVSRIGKEFYQKFK